MNINVRLNGALAQKIGTARLRIEVANSATVNDLLVQLRQRYPYSEQILNSAVPFASGQHLSPASPLSDGQEIALLVPVAGG